MGNVFCNDLTRKRMDNTVRFYLAVATVFFAVTKGDANLVYKINEDGSFYFSAEGNAKFNLTNGEVFLQSRKMMYSTTDDTLMLKSNKTISGSDSNGKYEGMVFSYRTNEQQNQASMENQVLVYNEGEFVRFTQSFPQGVSQTNVSNTNALLSAFPTFMTMKGLEDVGFLHMNGDMCGYSFSIGNFTMGSAMLHSGQEAGPLVMFDEVGNVIVLSAFSNFMAHNMLYNSTLQQLQFGILGGFSSIPERYQIDTILYYGNQGINRAIEGWGEVISRRYHKSRMHRDHDLTVNYLGYYTDNGAYYYYHTEPNKTYEETILDSLHYAVAEGLPYQYIQYDSWWYYKGMANGVKEWTAMSSVFPNGTEGLFREHGMPVAAHNRYWSSDTVYAKENGGKYNFLIDDVSFKAVPNDNNFWYDFLHNATKWGLTMYEQDWLDVEFEGTTELQTNINLGKDWLMQMGRAAEEHGMTIQYCMALPRHMLQSIEIPVVTQARVSGDYHPGNSQWKIGVTSMFAHALHLAPFKDTFWSTTHQEGSPYTSDEPNTDLQAAIATFSTGPVGPGDKIGSMQPSLLKTCRNDGKILKPSRPITVWDQHLANHAFPKNMKAGSPNLDAEVYSTYTELYYSSTFMRHGILLVTDLTVDNFAVKPDVMHLNTSGGRSYIAYHGHPGDDGVLHKFSDTQMLTIPKCGRTDFQLWYASPVVVMSSGTRVAILGERNKWVPISEQRIKNIENKGDNMLIDLEGKPGEAITFGFSINETVTFIFCNIPTTGKVRISLNARTCFSL